MNNLNELGHKEHELLLETYKAYVENCLAHNHPSERVVPISIEQYFETDFQTFLENEYIEPLHITPTDLKHIDYLLKDGVEPLKDSDDLNELLTYLPKMLYTIRQMQKN